MVIGSKQVDLGGGGGHARVVYITLSYSSAAHTALPAGHQVIGIVPLPDDAKSVITANRCRAGHLLVSYGVGLYCVQPEPYWRIR